MVLKAGCDGWIRASRWVVSAVSAESGAGGSHLAVVARGWLLMLLTLCSGLPPKDLVTVLSDPAVSSLAVGSLSLLLPAVDPPQAFALRDPNELPGIDLVTPSWDLARLGVDRTPHPGVVIDRASALLGLRTSTLVFTVIHSVNLVLITTPPEDLVWALSWMLSPLRPLGVPVTRLSFQLLLALRFLPLVQEELQNLLRSLVSRAVSLRKLGFKAAFGLLLSVGERLLANILLRAEQGADALVARGGRVMPPDDFRLGSAQNQPSRWLNAVGVLALVLVVGMRGARYGAH